MIVLRDLTKEYESEGRKITAVQSIDMDIGNEIFGIIGLSGAGKSTLLRMINRLEEPTSGSVLINDTDITGLNKKELNKYRSKVGMIFQHFNLLKSRTVANNIAFPLEIAGYTKEQISKRVKELLNLVELEDKGDSYISQLSGGQKQRVAIARALANNPDILLCDEATSALDPKTTKVILNLLKNIKNKLGLTIILITHEMEVIREICDRVAIMEGGKVIEMGIVSDVFRRPKTQTAKSFLAPLNHEDFNNIDFDKYRNSKIYRLSFMGALVDQPVIFRLIKEFDIEINIISGNIQQLQSSSLGNLVVEIKGDNEEVEKSIAWLIEMGIELDVINNG